MSQPVNPKPPRRYDSTRRTLQAQHTRRDVLEAARERFLADGYAATTLPEVARAAGVSVETIYKAFANKAGVLKALIDVSVAGDDEPIAMADRDVIAAVIAAPDAARKIELYCEHLTTAMPRSAPIQLLARDAAASDAGAADVWREMRAQLLEAMTMFARDLASTGQLTVPTDEARDVLWAHHAPEVYELLVIERRWRPQRYGQFLARSLVAALLADGDDPRREGTP